MRRTIFVLQAGRAVAALAVVFYHANLSVNAIVNRVPPAIDAVLSRGYLGVDFFFVLSGFIIYWTTVGEARSAGVAKKFAWRRLVRIFVPYWPIGLAMAFAYLAFPGLSQGVRGDDWSWVSTLTLLPSGRPPALSVA
jgi:peptidoglycan/LPS O-acetylase OafA/YrhL